MRYIFSLLASFCVVFSNAQEMLTPQQAIETTLENNYQIRKASNSVETTKAYNEWGNTNILPNIESGFWLTTASNSNYIQAITRSNIVKFQARLPEISLKELTGSLDF